MSIEKGTARVVKYLLCVFATVFAFPSLAVENFEIPRITEAPNINGKIDNTEWVSAKEIALNFEINPGNNSQANVGTSALIMEDGKYLYIAFKAFDPAPNRIRANLRERDDLADDDTVAVVFDTFNDHRRGFEFTVNPIGIQSDRMIDEVSGGSDESWDAVWDSEGRVTNDGYEVEIAIPFRALPFRSGLDKQIWGVNFLRFFLREQEVELSDSRFPRNSDCQLCQLNEMSGMPDIKESNNIDVTPTISYISEKQRNPYADNAPWIATRSEREAGVNLKWAISPNQVLHATVNPDFSQVETDEIQLNINRTFSLFFPETRPFFLDGANFFSSNQPIIHTRNIAIPEYVVKYTNADQNNRSGLMVAKDTTTSFILPNNQGSNVAVLDGIDSDVVVGRLQHDMNERDNVSLSLTYRGAKDYRNIVTSVDGRYHLTNDDYFIFQTMFSDSKNPFEIRFRESGGQNPGEPARLIEVLPAEQSDSASWVSYRRNKENYNLFVNYSDFGKDFRADMGSINQVDYKNLTAGGNYIWYGEELDFWTEWDLSSNYSRTEDRQGNLLTERKLLSFSSAGENLLSIQVSLEDQRRFFLDQYFDQITRSVSFGYNPSDNISLSLSVSEGDQVDFENARLGEQVSVSSSVSMQMNQNLSISVEGGYETLDVPGLQNQDIVRLFTAKTLDIRSVYQFNKESGLSLIVQWVSVDSFEGTEQDPNARSSFDELASQLVYTYEINPLSLLYVGYSENAIKDDVLTSFEKTGKSLFLKFSYLWQY